MKKIKISRYKYCAIWFTLADLRSWKQMHLQLVAVYIILMP